MAVTTAEKIEVMQAHEVGETIEFRVKDTEKPDWYLVDSDYHIWDWKYLEFRIKPDQPEYRPFANAEEFKPHRDKWILADDGGTYRVIAYGDGGFVLDGFSLSFASIFEKHKFEDGTPCGVKL